MVFTNLGKENWKGIKLSPKTYDRLKEFCSFGFKTWDEAIAYLLDEEEKRANARYG